MRAPNAITVVLLALGVMSAGCTGTEGSKGPYDPEGTPARDEARAVALVEQASAAMPGDPDRAEELLREALAADLFHAKAHNNLGVLLLAKDDLYGAAHEFEWARKLLPGHPEPRVNLAITLERAGQVLEAEASYTSALEVYPGYMPALQGAARLAVGEGRRPAALLAWLDAIALGGESLVWRDWARVKSAELGRAR
mgnify:CR=1 FL=1